MSLSESKVMGSVYFYHLTERRLEDVLPPLLEKARGGFGRVVVRGNDRTLMERLDAALWQGDGFLPHGLAGGPHDAEQPVLLTTERDGHDAACLMTVYGADFTAEDAARVKRGCVVFDGSNPAELQSARSQWKSITSAGVAAQYWADEGGWVKKAESG